MRLSSPFPRRSLKARLISNYLVILGIGGLATSLVGSWIVSSTIMAQARRSVGHDLATAHTVYYDELERLRLAVAFAASGLALPASSPAHGGADPAAALHALHSRVRFDFLGVAGADGRVILRLRQPGRRGDDVSSIRVVKAALKGESAAATERVPAESLAAEDPALAERARTRVIPTRNAGPPDRAEEAAGLVMMAAAPVLGPGRKPVGVLYGGILLNRNFTIVDRVWNLLFRGEQFRGETVGTVTIFLNDLRVSTTVRGLDGQRAVGTRVSAAVRDAVLRRGRQWRDRAFVVNDWYISAYEPIRDYGGNNIGILYVGLLERSFTSIRDRVILSFFGLATTGFIFIIGITYYEIRKITRPIGEMVDATRNIAAGRFDQEVRTDAAGEVALLATSFNTMLRGLRQMKGDLEEWGRTLEAKVRERTDELVAMQARMAQADRLASIGKLAAGVAHEINNPLGGIMALTGLALEDMPRDDPTRENLEEVLKQAERCRDIVRGLLEFSRQSEVAMELLDLNKVLLDTLSLLAKQALFFNINTRKDLEPELPSVMGDASQLQQVFMNILMNAVQAMQERGTVTIATRRVTAAKSVEVLIADTGCGIPPDKIDRVFDPFFTTKTSEQGTGLGLSIAYGIVSSHGGTISVRSDPGAGATFTVRLPVAAVTQPAA